MNCFLLEFSFDFYSFVVVVLRLKSNWTDFFEDWMIPYYHYVPVNSIEDFPKQVEWVLVCRKIFLYLRILNEINILTH
jgi:hypothetical protein